MKRLTICLPLLAGALAFTSCAPKGPLAESFQPISPTQDKVNVMRTSLKTHDLRLTELRKKGWRVSGESVLTSATRLSEYELKKTAVSKGAHTVLISEASVIVEGSAVAPVSSSSSHPKTTVAAPAVGRSALIVSRVPEKSAPLPQQELYRINALMTTSSSPAGATAPQQAAAPKKQIKWSYRVSFLSHS